jgi:hypothetical protein
LDRDKISRVSDWTRGDLDAYNICVHVEDTATFGCVAVGVVTLRDVGDVTAFLKRLGCEYLEPGVHGAGLTGYLALPFQPFCERRTAITKQVYAQRRR